MSLDLADYKRMTRRLDTDGIDFDAFVDQPLDAGTLRCLQYMHDVEHHTVCYLRDLLVTSAHRSHEITSFLAFWVHEEYWHGEALGEVLARHGLRSGPDRIERMRRGLGLRDRLAPFTHMLGSALAGESFVAIHMTWGAVNEWTTQAGYSRVIRRADHPVLTELLKRIMRQEGRHIDFYAGQAADRLADDRRAQRLTRIALRRFWRPVGATVMPATEVAHMVRHLFSGSEGRATAERVDGRVDRLPGLDGLALVTTAVDEVARTAAARADQVVKSYSVTPPTVVAV